MPLHPPLPQHHNHLPAFTREVLGDWIARIKNGEIRIHLPNLRGIMKPTPKKTFHLHPELFLQLSGRTFFSFPEERLTVEEGEICVVPRGLPHHETVQSGASPFANLVFAYPRKEIIYHLAHERPERTPTISVSGHLDSFPSGATLLEQMTLLIPHPEQTREEAVRALMVAHLSMIQIALQGEAPSNPAEPFKVLLLRQRITEKICDPNLTVASLAKDLQCNADYLSQLFKKNTGVSLQTYINQYRLSRAYEILRYSSLNITEVAAAAGFRDPSYFTRAFRKWYGVTPRELRKETGGYLNV